MSAFDGAAFDLGVERVLVASASISSLCAVVLHVPPTASRAELVHVYGGARSADPSTLFRIASMTKSFTAAAVLKLRDQRLLSLDDEVPEATPLPTTDSAPITVRDLLTHSGGMATDDPWGDRQLAIDEAAFDALNERSFGRYARAPGTGFTYSNWGYALLGRVVQRASGRPCQQYITEELLQPLGMHHTRWSSPEPVHATEARDGCFAPMGGLWSTAADLAVWVHFLLDAFPARDGPDSAVLRRASRREMQQGKRWVDCAQGYHYGFGLNVSLHRSMGTCVFHSGGLPGWGSHMRWSLTRRVAVVALANATYAPMRAMVAAHFDDETLWRAWAPVPDVEAHSAALLLAVAADLLRLLNAWRDEQAAALFADNVAMDKPWTQRRTEAAALGGALRMASLTCTSAASARILLEGLPELAIDFSLAPLRDRVAVQEYLVVRLPPK